MARKPSIPKGTRDFGQQEMAERNYIFDTIRSVYKTYGYAQIETPAMENLSTLLGKYGDEGDKLLFRILNSGNAFNNIDMRSFEGDEGLDYQSLTKEICDKGLRYDLTVPFARFVVQHQNEIVFPFRRYQNLCGGLIGLRKAVIGSFISVMPMLSGVRHRLMNLNLFRLSIEYLPCSG